jgi:hypothetical protein
VVDIYVLNNVPAQWRRSNMMRMISGIGIPTSQSKIGMVVSPFVFEG